MTLTPSTKRRNRRLPHRLKDALPASEALIGLLSDDVDLTKLDGRARLTALALPKI